MFKGKPLARSAKACHHLVSDVANAEFVTQRSHAFEITRWRHHDACGSRHGFQDDGGNGGRTLKGNDVPQVLECPTAFFGLGGGMKRTSIEKWAKEVHDASSCSVTRPTTVVTGQVDRRRRRAVVAAIGRQDLVAARVEASHPDGVFNRFGPAIGEEHLVERSRSPLCNQASRFRALVVRVLGSNRAELGCLSLNRSHHLGVLVANIGVHELTRKIEVALARSIGQVAAFSCVDDHGRNGALSGP